MMEFFFLYYGFTNVFLLHSPLNDNMHKCVHACVCVDGGGEFCLEEGRIAKFQSYLIELRIQAL